MKTPQPAPCRTYHVLDSGEPAYTERFDDVLKFHPPGLAAVQKGDQAWHIRPDGSAAYSARFERTFGFYDGRATVVDIEGWYHIETSGEAVYSDRYTWCGNFQDGLCTVREGVEYFHIKRDGRPLYERRWRYAGDYRDKIAVVQNEAGLSTHIDASGQLLHNVFFVDLDVFHKGFARARDEDGWTHIDARGDSIYQRRFANVEPFYNGQARVERFDGGLEIIDEAGNCMLELRPSRRSEFAELSGDLVGFWRTQTLGAAAKLGIIDVLPGTVSAISERCNITEDAAFRILRALGELQVVERCGDEWKTTSRGEYLKKDHPLTLADAAVEYATRFSKMWQVLPDVLKGEDQWKPAIFEDVFLGPDKGTGHHRMLRSYARHDYEAVAEILPLKGDESIVDAGGGLGTFASCIQARFPDVQITVLEKPGVLEFTQLREPGLNWMAGDFFQDWGVEVDVVLLARVLHDWEDEDARRILSRAKKSLKEGGRVFVVEMLLPEEGVSGGLCDLHLWMATGGRERKRTEYETLLTEAGFRVDEIIHAAALPSVIVGVVS